MAASVTVNSIPHLFNAVPEIHGVTIISTTPAVANVDGTASSPVNKNVLIHLGLSMTQLILTQLSADAKGSDRWQLAIRVFRVSQVASLPHRPFVLCARYKPEGTTRGLNNNGAG